MMALTHAAIAAAGTSLILGTADPLPLGLAVLGSQLPDLDTSTSIIGQVLFPISQWLEERFPHRTVTHSLLATGVIAAVALPLGYYWGNLLAAIALPLGHLLSCFSDCFTLQGVQLFYPNPVWAVIVSNPNRRIKTGGASELWVLAGAIALLILGIHLANSGGITQQVSQQLGLKDGLVEVYDRNAASRHVYAQVKGVRSSDRSPIEGKFFILGTAGSEFVVTDGKGVYKTGENLIASRLTTTVGEEASTTVQTVTFDDEEAVEVLERLRSQFPQAAIYLSGTVTVDFPEDVRVVPNADQYQTVTLSGSSVQMEYCGVEEAIAVLKDQYAVGTVTAKIVQPRPSFNAF